MAFGAAMIAQGAGQATGRIQAYKDQVAQEADMKRLQQQQAQFDATQKENSREFDAQQQIRTAQEGRAAADATRTTDQWKPADPKTGFPGGYLWQKAQQDIKSGNTANAGAALTNTGKALDNTAKALDIQWAPIANNLKVLTTEQSLTNNAGRDPASEQQRALELQTHAAQLQQSLYTYKAKIDSSVTADPTAVAKEYDAAQKGVQASLKGLDTKGADALGKPVNLVSPQARQAAASKAAEISAAPDPFAAADQAIASMPKDGGSPFVADYLAEVARAAYIQRKMLGSKGPSPAPAGAPVPPAPNGWAAPGSPTFMQPPKPFGSTTGGSSAAAPFVP